MSFMKPDGSLDYGTAMEEVKRAVRELGYPDISPESLTAIAEANSGDYGWSSNRLRAAYNVTMEGFRRLLAPVPLTFEQWMVEVDRLADDHGFRPKPDPRDLEAWRKHFNFGLSPQQAWNSEPFRAL